MNRSNSPIQRPLSNISNRNLTFNKLSTKQNDSTSKAFAPNSVIFPQHFETTKSTIQEVKSSTKNMITPKSSITSFTSTPRLSSNNYDDRKSKMLKKSFNNQQKTKFVLFKILVFLSIIAVALLLYQIQANLFSQTKSNKISGEVQIAKEKMIADSISNSIIQTVVYERKKINLQKEKNDVESFYQDDFSSNLWKLVLENVNKDLRVRVEKQENEEFWTV
ncbi:unnamed protein product [Paramecium octaurelia]|uniref:Uncharacterized protein n=1 Tax=Paramecium octaurelia TaxID=43137 RepID=A0A8S1V079_PAROT|nr:unnamed protein product [Paramecium octaurelia]